MGKPVLMQRIIHVNGRPVHVIVFCVLSMAGPFIALYYGLWRSPNILLLWSAGQPPRGGGVWPGGILENCAGRDVVTQALYITLYKSSTGIAGLECRRCRNGELVFGSSTYCTLGSS